MDLAWLLGDVSFKPESHARERDAEEASQGERQQRAFQVRLRLGGRDHVINRIGRLTIQLPKPGGKPSVPRSGGMRSRQIWTFP